MNKIVTVFGSARPKKGTPEYELAYEVGNMLAQSGFSVCTGGFGGTMEASSRGAKEGGGRTIGVTFNLAGRKPNRWVDDHIHVPTLMERMLKLVELGDAYVILKGGTGTLLELATVWEFINKGLMKEKPIVIVGNFWNGVIETLRQELLWEGEGDCTKFIYCTQYATDCITYIQKRLL